MLNIKFILSRTIKKCIPIILFSSIILNYNEITLGTTMSPKTNVETKSANISREDVIKLIKEQGTKSNFFI